MGTNSTKDQSNLIMSSQPSDDTNKQEASNTPYDDSNSAKVSRYLEDKFKNADFSKLDDLLIDILSFVSAEDLIFNCRLVCKQWNEIIDGHSVWKIKCEREKKRIPSVTFAELPKNYYQNIYIFNPYGRNLVINPCGEAEFEGWMVRQPGFSVENPPQGTDVVPLEVGSQSCFATTYEMCEKIQLIDLLSYRIPREVLKAETTKLEIGEWYAARFDCASEYKLTVSLLTLQRAVDTPVGPEDEFNFTFEEEQWLGREWHKVTHTFEKLGNATCVCFQHGGKDKQFWAGHYGTKMTGAYVKVIA